VDKFVYFEEDDAAAGKGWVVAVAVEIPSATSPSYQDRNVETGDKDQEKEKDRRERFTRERSRFHTNDEGYHAAVEPPYPPSKSAENPELSTDSIARSLRSHVLKYGTEGALAAASCGSYFRSLDPTSSFPGLKRFCQLPGVDKFVYFEEDDAAAGKGWVVAVQMGWGEDGVLEDSPPAPRGESVQALKKLLSRDSTSSTPIYPDSTDGTNTHSQSHHTRKSHTDNVCFYYQKGYCKNGTQCKFLHVDKTDSNGGEEGEREREKDSSARTAFRQAATRLNSSSGQGRERVRDISSLQTSSRRRAISSVDEPVIELQINMADMLEPTLPGTDREYFASRVYLLLCNEIKAQFDLYFTPATKGCLLTLKGPESVVNAANTALQERLSSVVYWISPVDMHTRAGNELAYEWTKGKLQHLSHNFQVYAREHPHTHHHHRGGGGGGGTEDNAFDRTPTFHVYSPKPRDELKRSKIVVIALPEEQRTVDSWRRDIEAQLTSYETTIWRVPSELTPDQCRLLEEECHAIEGRHRFLRVDYQKHNGIVNLMGNIRDALRRLDGFLDEFDHVTRMVTFPSCESCMEVYFREHATDPLIRYALESMRSKAQVDNSLSIDMLCWDRHRLSHADGSIIRQDVFEIAGPKRMVDIAATKLKELLDEFVESMSLQQFIVKPHEDILIRTLCKNNTEEFNNIAVYFGSDRFKRYYSCVWPPGVRIEVIHSDFFCTASKLRADVLLYPTLEDLKHTHGLSDIICNSAGKEFIAECSGLYEVVQKASPGVALSRIAGNLEKIGFKKLIQCIVPNPISSSGINTNGSEKEEDNANTMTFRQSIRAGLLEASKHDVTSLAIPGMCLGHTTHRISAISVLKVVTEFITENVGNIRSIVLFDSREEVVLAYKTALSNLRGHDMDQLPTASLPANGEESIDLTDDMLLQRRVELFGTSGRVHQAFTTIQDGMKLRG